MQMTKMSFWRSSGKRQKCRGLIQSRVICNGESFLKLMKLITDSIRVIAEENVYRYTVRHCIVLWYGIVQWYGKILWYITSFYIVNGL